MAMGIPIVASPVRERECVTEHKVNGFFAKTVEDLRQYLKALKEDDKLRETIRNHGRKNS
jgi:glycosyltransferase involved in cell wall biosynthesis